MKRACKVCGRYYDPDKVRQGVPQGICTRACSIDSKRLKASERASRRRVPPRTPARLFAATSRQWGDVNGACRVCGEPRVDRAHVIPRSLARTAETAGSTSSPCAGRITASTTAATWTFSRTSPSTSRPRLSRRPAG